LFEDINKSYEELSREDYETYLDYGVAKNADYESLMDRLVKNGISMRGFYIYQNRWIENNNTIFILKMPDEWYYVEYFTDTHDLRSGKRHYKCDQFDGLLDCLKKELGL
jgi:hypothetical protein